VTGVGLETVGLGFSPVVTCPGICCPVDASVVWVWLMEASQLVETVWAAAGRAAVQTSAGELSGTVSGTGGAAGTKLSWTHCNGGSHWEATGSAAGEAAWSDARLELGSASGFDTEGTGTRTVGGGGGGSALCLQSGNSSSLSPGRNVSIFSHVTDHNGVGFPAAVKNRPRPLVSMTSNMFFRLSGRASARMSVLAEWQN